MYYANGWATWDDGTITDDGRELQRRNANRSGIMSRKRLRRRRALEAAKAARLARIAAEAPPLKMSGTRPARNQ